MKLNDFGRVKMIENNLMKTAKWIACEKYNNTHYTKGERNKTECGILFKTFNADKIKRAALTYSILGFGDVYINDKPLRKLKTSVLWSDFHTPRVAEYKYPTSGEGAHTYYYAAADVTDMINDGENVISIWLGNGWYHQICRQNEGFIDYGVPKVKAELVLTDDADAVTVISTDNSFKRLKSPVVFNNIYFGEEYDSRIPLLLSGKTDMSAYECDDFSSVAMPENCPLDKEIKQIAPRLVMTVGDKFVYDMGENLSGVVSFVTDAESGTKITMEYAEEITPSGPDIEKMTIWGGVEQKDIYIANGKNAQRYKTQFCIHGFRYFSVDYPVRDIMCHIIHTDLKETGSFKTSSEIINRLYDCFKRSFLANCHNGVISDCPHRERLGYTGDGSLVADTAMCTWELEDFYGKWLRDIADGQCKKSGHVKNTAPFYGGAGSAISWGGAIVLVPWQMYIHYGKKEYLESYYDNMVRFADYIIGRLDGYVYRKTDEMTYLGDWFPPKNDVADPDFINSCMVIYVFDVLSAVCRTLNKDFDLYKNTQEKIRAALREIYFCGDELVQKDKGAMLMAYTAGLVSANALGEYIKTYAARPLDTGIITTPFLFKYLIESGNADIAVDMLERTEYPSFGYMLENNATGLWETFEGQASHNHHMYGAFFGELFKGLAGIVPTEAGYKSFEVRPAYCKNLTELWCRIPVPYGIIEVSYNKDEIIIDVPAECKCKYKNLTLTGGRHRFERSMV